MNEKKYAACISGKKYEVLEMVSKGSIITVFKVKDTAYDKEYLLYMIKKECSINVLNNLKKLVKLGSPSGNIMWPLDITEPTGPHKYIGYITNIIPNGYTRLSRMIKRPTFISGSALLKSLINVSKIVDEIHRRGLNINSLGPESFMAADNGDVLLIDTYPLSENINVTGLKGASKFMAPEVCNDKYMPDSLSDNFSLAVIIFNMLTDGYPYDGKARLERGPLTSPRVMHELRGSEAIFIFDPKDKANEADPEVDKAVIENWNDLPEFMKNLFIRAFSFDINNIEKIREARPNPKEWIAGLEKYIDLIEKVSRRS